MTARPEHAYVSVLSCGCVVGAAVDNPDHRGDVRRWVSSELRHDDVAIHRVPTDDVPGMRWVDGWPHPSPCPHADERVEVES